MSLQTFHDTKVRILPTIDSAITLIFSYRVTDEKRFRDYLQKVLPVTEADEPYMLEYEIYKNAEGIYIQHEVYADADALSKHFKLTAEGQADWAAATDLINLVALGDPPADWFETHQIPRSTAYSKFRSVAR
jgi:quinol monooxygenase YgiN